MSMAHIFPLHRESASWESMSAGSRIAVAKVAGFNNPHTQKRMAAATWAELYDHERTALYRVNWRNVIARAERRRV